MSNNPPFWKKYRTWLAISGIVIVLIGLGWWRNAKNNQPQLTFDAVTRATISDIVSESGNIQAKGQANIAAPIEGIVQQIFVANGDQVSRNQALFSIQSTASEIEKSASYASLLAAQTNTTVTKQTELVLGAALDTAKSQSYTAQNNYNIVYKGYHSHANNPATNKNYKYVELQSSDAALVAAQENVNVAEQKYNNSAETIASAEAAEASAQLNYDSKTTFRVKAPASGIVSNIGINPGDKVSALTQANPPMILSQSNKQSVMEFITQINEIDVAKLKVDQSATISIDAVKNKTFDAKITNIDLIGTNVSGVITYNVYFTLNESDETIRPGMSGNVDIEVTRHENVLTVSSAAVKPYQDTKAVQVIDPSLPKKNNQPQLKYVPVKIGIKDAQRTEILDGLTEGTEVVVNNTSNQFKSSLFGG